VRMLDIYTNTNTSASEVQGDAGLLGETRQSQRCFHCICHYDQLPKNQHCNHSM